MLCAPETFRLHSPCRKNKKKLTKGEPMSEMPRKSSLIQ